MPFCGGTASAIDDIGSYADQGMTGLTLHLQSNDLDETLEQLQRYAEDVLPHFRS